MTITVKKIHLVAQEAEPSNIKVADNYLELLGQLEVQCQVKLGDITLNIEALQKLSVGEVLCLQQSVDEPVAIILNNQIIARGELVTVDECFAVRLTEVAQ